MARMKQFSDEEKLDMIIASILAEDIRELLTGGIHRKHILAVSQWSIDNGIINQFTLEDIYRKIERPKAFPSDPEQRLEALLSVANTEPKIMTGLLLDDSAKDSTQLRDEFVGVTSGIWNSHLKTNIEGYVLYSLDPIGFMVFSRLKENLDIGYSRTESGRIYGQPVLAFNLYMGNQINLSMYQILGQTATHGDSRSTYNRFKILEYLLIRKRQNKDTRMSDISMFLNLCPAGVRGHLDVLRKAGIVDYDSTDVEKKGQSIYHWQDKEKKPENVGPVNGDKTFALEVARYLFENGQGERNEITEHLLIKWRDRNLKRDQLLKRVSGMLGGIAKQGFAKANYMGRNIQSHVWLRDEYVDFVDEFTRKLRGTAQDGNEIKALTELYNKYMEDYELFKQHATNNLSLYLPVSPHINRLTSEDAEARILDYLKGKKARPRDMIKDLSINVNNHLSVMSKKKLLIKSKEGSASWYEINPDYMANLPEREISPS